MSFEIGRATCLQCGTTIGVSGEEARCPVCGAALIPDSDGSLDKAGADSAGGNDPDSGGQDVPDAGETPDAPDMSESLKEGQQLLDTGSFSRAERVFAYILQENSCCHDARWGLIRARTKNLEIIALDSPEDFCLSESTRLLDGAPDSLAVPWRQRYLEAYAACCAKTLRDVDPRVFIAVQVYRWNARENRFEYPIDQNFDIVSFLDKHLRARMDALGEALPDEAHRRFTAEVDALVSSIAALFREGFSNVDALRSGNFSKLHGNWKLEQNCGEMKANLLCFSANKLGVQYCEAMRSEYNRYEYYRFVSCDAGGALTCREARFFPSRSGAFGDFRAHEQPEPFLTIFALYDFLLVLPTALFVKKNISGAAEWQHALAYRKKCMTMLTFSRSDESGSVQIRPITETHHTAEPSRPVSSCFIATAAFQSRDAFEVRRLRLFRDETLHRYRMGRRFTAWYYRNGPALAKLLSRRPVMIAAVRGLLRAFVSMLPRRPV